LIFLVSGDVMCLLISVKKRTEGAQWIEMLKGSWYF